MAEQINIKGLDKGAVVAALYNNSKPLGLGILHYDPKPMSPEEGEMFANNYIDYLKGRVMKVDVTGDTLDTWGYDRDNGEGAAARAIDSIRAK